MLLNNKTIYVLDGHGLLYQLFHALGDMKSPSGEPVGALFGLARDLFTLLETKKPDYLFCAFDRHEPTFRTKLYPQYKVNRSEMPEDLKPQIALASELLEAMGGISISFAGFEADDILATISCQTTQLGGECVLVTSDKDCRQLISPAVSIYQLRKQSFYRAAELKSDWGILPDQVVDFQALVGDTSDNIPGVSQIGPKTATELLSRFQTLTGIYENLDEAAKGKKRESLEAGRESAFLSKQLAELKNDVPISIDWETSMYKGFNIEKLRKLFVRFGFRSLMQKISSPDDFAWNSRSNLTNSSSDSTNLFVSDSETKIATDISRNTSNTLSFPHKSTSKGLFDNETTPIPDSIKQGEHNCVQKNEVTYHLVDSLEKFDDFFAKLRGVSLFAFDTETSAIAPQFEATAPRYVVPVGFSFAWNDQEAWYLPFLGPLGAETIPKQQTLEKLKPIFENDSIRKIGQNIKFDAIVLENEGITMRGSLFDTMIADYILQPESWHNLDELALRYLNHETIKISDLIGSGKKQKRMSDVQTEDVAKYAGEDALVVWRLYSILKRKIESDAVLNDLFCKIEMPLVDLLREMEVTGMSVDVEILHRLSKQFGDALMKLESEIHELAGHSFNIASPKQLSVVLFDELGLKKGKKTSTGQSTDIEVLEELSELHPLPKKVIEYRQLSKLKGTYIDALPELIHPKTGRIHSSFNQVATATGRLSSSNPNLQNIPVRSEHGQAIRSAFKPGKGFDLLLSCDYSQIELRVLAHFSCDHRLCESFQNNEDIHTRVASEVFGVIAEDVTSEMRRVAKAVNFGVIYGQSSFGLAKQLGISQEEARQFIEEYFQKYSSIQNYLDSILEECRRTGYVSTLFGHRRFFAEGTIRDTRKGNLNQSERMAINTVIQGSAADLMKQAMIRLRKTIPPNLRANLLLQIHDELVFEVTQEDAELLKQIVVDTMLLDQPLHVPLVVDSDLADCWH
ncbi:MAG: DNA polymerase I [Thermoguttaceae bacterium]